MDYRFASASGVPAPRDVTGPRRPTARLHRRHTGPSLPTSLSNSSSGIAARPITPAEAAQARLFERIFRAELVELRHREQFVARYAARRGAHDQRSSEQHTELSARIRELSDLLGALRDRFGAPATEDFMSPRAQAI